MPIRVDAIGNSALFFSAMTNKGTTNRNRSCRVTLVVTWPVFFYEVYIPLPFLYIPLSYLLLATSTRPYLWDPYGSVNYGKKSLLSPLATITDSTSNLSPHPTLEPEQEQY